MLFNTGILKLARNLESNKKGIKYNDNYSSNSELFLSTVTLRLLTEVETRHPVKLLCDTYH